MESLDILKIAANALNDKKATDMAAFEIVALTEMADYFLIATATSNTHVRALADEVEEKLKANGVMPNHIEGRATDWILLDYGWVVVHVFGKVSREFYALDKKWSDGKKIDLTKIVDSAMEE